MALTRRTPAEIVVTPPSAAAGSWPRCTRAIRSALRPGVTTADLDAIGRDVLAERGATSNFLGYHGVPGGHLRVDQRRGDPRRSRAGRRRPARRGRHRVDRLRGHRRRLARRRRLHRGGRSDRRRSGPADRPWSSRRWRRRSPRWCRAVGWATSGHAVEQVVADGGFAVVREYCGHGIGRAMHERPMCPTTGRPGRGGRSGARGGAGHRADGSSPGGPRSYVDDDRWSVVTADGTLGAHVEHTSPSPTTAPRSSPAPDASWAAAAARSVVAKRHYLVTLAGCRTAGGPCRTSPVRLGVGAVAAVGSSTGLLACRGFARPLESPGHEESAT